jgi:hypothetical protein
VTVFVSVTTFVTVSFEPPQAEARTTAPTRAATGALFRTRTR